MLALLALKFGGSRNEIIQGLTAGTFWMADQVDLLWGQWANVIKETDRRTSWRLHAPTDVELGSIDLKPSIRQLFEQ